MEKVLDRAERHYGWVIVLAGGLTIFSCLGLARFAYGMLLPSMGKDLGLSYDRMGFIGTGNFAGYLAAVALAPVFMRRWGGRRTVATALGLLAACMLLMGLCSGFLPVFALYVLTGVGSGLANVPMMVLVSHWFARTRRGRAAGMMLAGNGLAIIFAGLLIPALNRSLGAGGWRIGWQILGALSALVAVMVGLLLRNSPAELGLRPLGDEEPVDPKPAAPPPGAHVPAGAGKGLLAHLGVLYFIFGFTYVIYGTFIVTTMVAERGMPEILAGRFWAWVGFFSIFSGPLFGSLSDRIGRKGGFMAVFAVQTAAYGLAGVDLGAWALYLSVVLYGIAAWSIPTIMAAAVGDYFGPDRAAAGFSTVTVIFGAGQTLGPSVAGVMARNAGTFAPAYLMAAAATALAVFAALLLPRPR